MRVIRSTCNNGLTTYFDRITDAKEEAELFFENASMGDCMAYQIIEMTKKDYNALPEVERG